MSPSWSQGQAGSQAEQGKPSTRLERVPHKAPRELGHPAEAETTLGGSPSWPASPLDPLAPSPGSGKPRRSLPRGRRGPGGWWRSSGLLREPFAGSQGARTSTLRFSAEGPGVHPAQGPSPSQPAGGWARTGRVRAGVGRRTHVRETPGHCTPPPQVRVG